jgi:Rrf2 family protein
MLRINRQTDYAVRVLLALAKHPLGTRLSTAEVRDEMLIPKSVSLRVVADLARGGFIETFPGRDGGIKLARPAEEINLLQVTEHFEANFSVSECIHAKGLCPFEESCPVRRRWARLQKVITAELENITFSDLREDAIAIQNLATS